MAESCCAAHAALPPSSGSRRRRLWELGSHAHCPVIGVCVPLERVRVLARKLLVLQGDEDDYTLHCSLVTAAARRNAVAEALQKDLEQRFALDLRSAARAKCRDSLMAWWRGRAAQGENIAGALWATLTHARCDEWLEMRVLGQVHMLQHQVGAAQRVDMVRHRELQAEHQALARDYAEVQQRVTAWSQERAREQQAWERQRMQQRAELIALQTQLAQAREQLAHWQAARPDLPEREQLRERLAEQLERNQQLQREVNRLASRPVAEAVEPTPALRPADEAPAAVPARLEHRVVLCVGGRGGSVPQYRQAVEGCGAQFLHHDGGAEHKPAQLEPQLAAADLVICQTGCISHDAYWRVKDHCKRHGKRCVFVETPSRSAFERALAQAAAPAP
jgi:hypothetical protein